MRVIRRPRLHDERGFSLPELLVAMFIGLVILLAAFMLLDRTISASGQVADRTEALQRGRLALNLITRQLRSQVCVGSAAPIVSASDNSVSFYADLGDGTQPIKRRTLTFDPATDTATESVITGAGTYPALTFTSAPTTAPLLTNVQQIMDGATARPIFRYYGYKVGGAVGELESLGNSVSAADLKRVALIKVGFRAFAARNLTNDADSAVLEDDVYVRVAVPTDIQGGPTCI
ncbi:MAG: prepilin-type N-terminal cleavage/methylation domain-containing protein [Thermoleophilaceae bacterium]|nr:prepilin-type N-terminal cleavage/methylation domain-containing protein [Thermoleophilaceae bacterium]